LAALAEEPALEAVVDGVLVGGELVDGVLVDGVLVEDAVVGLVLDDTLARALDSEAEMDDSNEETDEDTEDPAEAARVLVTETELDVVILIVLDPELVPLVLAEAAQDADVGTETPSTAQS